MRWIMDKQDTSMPKLVPTLVAGLLLVTQLATAELGR